jgi:SulP family sulfate permease
MLQKVIPALEWFQNYKRENLKGDFAAGLIVAIMLVPQGMAYAMIAGLPPVVGLYASTFPLVTYVLFGSSRQLAVGPVAMMSLLVFAGVSSFAEPGSEKYVSLVLLLSLMVGVIQLCMGLLRAGFIVNFISHAVISGFTSAAAIIILLSQLHHLFGIKVLSGGHSAIHLLKEIIHGMGGIHPITFGIGLGSILVLLIFKKKLPNFPAPIVVVVLTVLAVYLFGLDQYGVSIVGHVPKGLPSWSWPDLGLDSLQDLFPAALTIFFVGFMESISVAEMIAAKEKYKIESNQELIGLGFANIVGSFFSAYPVTGGFSRTAVNYQAGARTGLASIITAAIVLLTLLFFTSFFHYLPHAVLAAIVIVAVAGLIDVKGAKHLFRLKRIDGWTLTITFVATLAIGSKEGILIGVAFSLLVFIWRSAHPFAAELGYLEKENVFRNLKRFPEGRTYPEALILRVDASLYFANMGFLEDFLRKRIVEKPNVKWIIMDLSGVNDMDAVAIDRLSEMMDSYRDQGIQFTWASMKGPVRDLVARAEWEKKYGKQMEYLSIHHALKGIGLL